jgi:uncharacterized protein YdbL (DUF1318 family)
VIAIDDLDAVRDAAHAAAVAAAEAQARVREAHQAYVGAIDARRAAVDGARTAQIRLDLAEEYKRTSDPAMRAAFARLWEAS